MIRAGSTPGSWATCGATTRCFGPSWICHRIVRAAHSASPGDRGNSCGIFRVKVSTITENLSSRWPQTGPARLRRGSRHSLTTLDQRRILVRESALWGGLMRRLGLQCVVVVAVLVVAGLAVPEPARAAAAVCSVYCDTRDPSLARQETFPVPRTATQRAAGGAARVRCGRDGVGQHRRRRCGRRGLA